MRRFLLPILFVSISINALATDIPKIKTLTNTGAHTRSRDLKLPYNKSQQLKNFPTEWQLPQIKLGGEIGTQIGYRQQKSPYNAIQDPDSTKKGNQLHKSAIINNVRLTFEADGNANGLGYGMYADASFNKSVDSAIVDEVWSYISTKFGDIEGGGTSSAGLYLSIYAWDVARATGGIDGAAKSWFNQYTINNLKKLSDNIDITDLFVISPGLPTFSKLTPNANKVVYYTPNIDGFQLGVGYVMDPTITGTITAFQEDDRSSGSGFKDVWDMSIRYEGEIKDLTYGLSLAGEVGKAKNGSDEADRDDLKAWLLGGKIGYKGVTLAGSYSDWMNTGRPKDRLAGAKFGSKHWTAGIGYLHGNFGVSTTYMESKNANSYIDSAVEKVDQDKSYNTYRIISFGTDYKLAEGLVTYGEVSMFEFNRAKSAVNNKGTIILAGTRLIF